MTGDILQALPGYGVLEEPRLLYHVTRTDDHDVHPLRGLGRFGPYGRSLLHSVVDPVVVSTIAPHGESKRPLQILREFENRHAPKERRNYLPEFPGFGAVFGTRVTAGGTGLQLELPRALDSSLSEGESPHRVLADALIRAVDQLDSRKTEFSVVFLYLPDRWAKAFRSKLDGDFDLHDYVKAFAAAKGIAVQFLNEGSALRYPCRCSVMWRLSIATYCKAGGTPWTVADIEEGTAFVGISYALQKTAVRDARFITCCSLVFDAEGSGPEFVLYEVDPTTMGAIRFCRATQCVRSCYEASTYIAGDMQGPRL